MECKVIAQDRKFQWSEMLGAVSDCCRDSLFRRELAI